jgi:hypothetical protein
MAKQEKKEVKDKVAEAAGAKLAEARAKREAARAKDRLVYKGESEKKLAPQAQVIVNAVKAAGKSAPTAPAASAEAEGAPVSSLETLKRMMRDGMDGYKPDMTAEQRKAMADLRAERRAMMERHRAERAASKPAR